MKILDLINRACTRCKMNSISKIAGSSELQAAEFLEYANQSAKFIADYYDCIRNGKHFEIDAYEASKVIRLTLGIYNSKGKTINI